MRKESKLLHTASLHEHASTSTRAIADHHAIGPLARRRRLKRTIIVANGAAADARRLQLARKSEHGFDVRTIEQVGERLAGGFLQVVDGDTLARMASDAVAAASPADLGDLTVVADLPGLPGALAATLSKAWLTDVEIAAEAATQPDVARLGALATFERAVLDRLPRAMLRPSEIADRAIARIHHADGVLGPVELDPYDRRAA